MVREALRTCYSLAAALASWMRVRAAGIGPRGRAFLFFWLAVVPSLVWAAFGFVRFHTSDGWWIPDDSFIYLRYVDDFLGGCGLQFNCYVDRVWGGGPVAGYTSALWLILEIPLRFATRRFLDATTMLHLASFFLALMAPLVLFRREGQGWEMGKYLLAAAFFLAPAATAAWALGGLETPLVWCYYGLLAVVPTARLGRKPLLAIGFLTYWIRPDLVLAAAVQFALDLFVDFRRALRFGAAVAAGAAAHALFLYAQYRMWLPNTFYAKAGGGIMQYQMGRLALSVFWQGHWPIFAACGVATAFLFILKKPRLTAIRPWLFCLPPIAFMLYSGGDIFPLWRHLTPIIAVLLLAAMAAVYDLPRKAAIVILAVLVIGVGASNDASSVKKEVTTTSLDRVAQAGIETAKELRKAEPRVLASETSIVATPFVGGMSWRLPCEVLDTLGLNDRIVARRHMADGAPGHTQYDPDYIMRVQPDIIFFNAVAKNPTFAGERLLYTMPEFKQVYRLKQFSRGYYYRHVRWEPPEAVATASLAMVHNP